MSTPCACGCGAPVEGSRAGQPLRFVHGHNGRRPAEERFWEKALKRDDGCWEWLGSRTPNGYGSFRVSKYVLRLAHRVSYEWAKGPIPDGLEIDHLCRTRACVNPDHLEAVTPSVNQRRGVGAAGINAAKTHCPAGHPYEGGDVYRRPNGGRECRTCARQARRERRARQGAAA